MNGIGLYIYSVFCFYQFFTNDKNNEKINCFLVTYCIFGGVEHILFGNHFSKDMVNGVWRKVVVSDPNHPNPVRSE